MENQGQGMRWRNAPKGASGNASENASENDSKNASTNASRNGSENAHRVLKQFFFTLNEIPNAAVVNLQLC